MKQSQNVASAYNNSIYMMVSVPYLLLGFFGVMIYRGVKKNEQFRAKMTPAETPPDGGVSAAD